MKLVARFCSNKYDEIFMLAKKEGTLEDFNAIERVTDHNGLVIDLEDDECSIEDTAMVTAETVEKLFGIKVKTEDEIYEDSQEAWTDGLLRAGLDPNEELRKVNEEFDL